MRRSVVGTGSQLYKQERVDIELTLSDMASMSVSLLRAPMALLVLLSRRRESASFALRYTGRKGQPLLTLHCKDQDSPFLILRGARTLSVSFSLTWGDALPSSP